MKLKFTVVAICFGAITIGCGGPRGTVTGPAASAGAPISWGNAFGDPQSVSMVVGEVKPLLAKIESESYDAAQLAGITIVNVTWDMKVFNSAIAGLSDGKAMPATITQAAAGKQKFQLATTANAVALKEGETSVTVDGKFTVVKGGEQFNYTTQTSLFITVKAAPVVPAIPTCIAAPATVVFSVQKVSDPGGFDGTIGLGTVLSITTQVNTPPTPGNMTIVGGNKMNGYNVDQVSTVGAAPNASNNCSMDLNGGAVVFGPGTHRTRLYGNATRTVGTKLTYEFLDFFTNVLQTRYEFTVVSVQ